MIRQILFDCGGVFVDIRFRELILDATGDTKLADLFWDRIFAPGSPWILYDQGLLTTDEVRQRLGEWVPEIPPAALDRFMKEWPRWLPTFPEMEGIVDALHEAGLKCYMLSNFSEQFEEFAAYTPAIRHLDGKIISYAVHHLKPHREIFELAAERFGIRPEETLFIDDAPHNVAGAREVGYEAYLNVNPVALHTYLKVRGLLN